MLENLRIYLELAVDEVSGDTGAETTPDTSTDTTETSDTTETTDASLDNTPQETFFELDGEKLTPQQIKEYKQGFLRQSDYTKKTQEIASLRKEHQEAIELYEYLKANPQITEKLAELDGTKVPNQSTLKVDPEVQQMKLQLKSMEIDRELSQIKQSNPDINEIQILDIASQRNCSVKEAYTYWLGENFDNILKDKLAKHSAELTETIRKGNNATKTLMKSNDNTNSNGKYGLSQAEILMADKLGMEYSEYAKWK